MMWAYWRRDLHMTSRLAAAGSMASTAYLCYQAYLGNANTGLAVTTVAFVLTMVTVAVAKGRFHAPPR